MKNLLDRILRAPDGGGGAAPPAAAPPAPGGEPSATPLAAAPPAVAPPAVAPPAGAATPYRPEGLPDEWLGETEKDTIDRLAKVAKGYRERDSKAGVPEDVAEYRKFEGDGMFDDIAAVAKEEGISTKAFQRLVGKYMGAAAEMGILEPPVDKAVERAALLPEGAKDLPKAQQDAAIDRRMNDNLAWLGQMKDRGLAEESIDHMTMMLGDSAKGHQAIEFFRSQMTGSEAPRPGGVQDGGKPGGSAGEALRARAALPQNDPGNAKFDKASYDQLQVDYQKTFPGE